MHDVSKISIFNLNKGHEGHLYALITAMSSTVSKTKNKACLPVGQGQFLVAGIRAADWITHHLSSLSRPTGGAVPRCVTPR